MDNYFLDILDKNLIPYEIRESEVWYQCPWDGHNNNDKNYSASYSFLRNKCNCFVHGGDLIGLISFLNKVSRKESKEIVDVGIASTEDYRNKFIVDELLRDEEIGLDIIKALNYEKQIQKEYTFDKFTSNMALIKKLRIGFDEENKRVTIPVLDRKGIIKLVIKRSISNKCKLRYLYEPKGVKKSDYVYGIDFYKDPEYLIVVEGVKDVIRCLDKGIKNVVAILGSKMSNKQAEIISNKIGHKRLFLALDNDFAGHNGMQQIMERYYVDFSLYLFKHPEPDGRDMAEYSKEEIIHGIKNAEYVVPWKI